MAGSYDSSVSVVVLRAVLSEGAARSMAERKKHTVFGSLLSRPKEDVVHLQDVELSYECMRTVSGRYESDYLRGATHTLTVDKSVRRVVIGDSSFETRPQSRLKKALAVQRGSNKIDVDLKEHVAIDRSLEITFDADGNEIQKPKYKINPDTTEVSPDSILGSDDLLIKSPSMEREDAVAILEERLRSPLEPGAEELSDEFDLDSITELYVPIFEIRIRGPRNKVGIMRIDAARKKIL